MGLISSGNLRFLKRTAKTSWSLCRKPAMIMSGLSPRENPLFTVNKGLFFSFIERIITFTMVPISFTLFSRWLTALGFRGTLRGRPYTEAEIEWARKKTNKKQRNLHVDAAYSSVVWTLYIQGLDQESLVITRSLNHRWLQLTPSRLRYHRHRKHSIFESTLHNYFNISKMQFLPQIVQSILLPLIFRTIFKERNAKQGLFG